MSIEVGHKIPDVDVTIPGDDGMPKPGVDLSSVENVLSNL